MCTKTVPSITPPINEDIDYGSSVIIQARAKAYALLLKWREEDTREDSKQVDALVTGSDNGDSKERQGL